MPIFALVLMLAVSLPCVLRAEDPVFPYGAVYFRKSNPPPEDWEKDHRTAAKMGMNNFRHWVMWSAIETAPGRYDWSDYDRMMDLAAKSGIRVTLAEMVTAAPEWMFDKYPHARYHFSDDSIQYSQISGSSATGGFPGLCLDNEDVKDRAGQFLTAMIGRYKDHAAMWAWDLWNEHSYPGGAPPRMLCYCEATQRKFREWLKAKYGSLDALGKAWYRYSFADWDNVHPPRNFGGYPESLDWLQFRIDNQFRLFQWRLDLFRKLDQRSKIAAHGVASTLEGLPGSTNDEWRSAANVDVWGFTWVASRKGNEPWKQFHAVDLVRAGSRGKPFWHAEAQAGPLWMQPQVTGRPREDGRISDEKDVRIWNLISMAGGATGILYPRWRPLLDGPLFGAFGAFGMDGGVTPRASMAGEMARWANEHPGLWKARPAKGDAGIVFVPESEIFNFVQQGSTRHYAESIRGAYQAFFDSNIQADFVHIDEIRGYRLIYLPYPVHLTAATVKKLIAFVQEGGLLVSEGLPAYFGEHGKAGEHQPNLGLDALFGAQETYVEFTPDLLDRLEFTLKGQTTGGRFFLQHYQAAKDAQAAGAFADGATAAVEHAFGKGRTLLIGTFPGASYFLHHAPGTKSFFASLLDWAGIRQQVTVSSPDVKARLHSGPSGAYLWIVNPNHQSRTVSVTLAPSAGSFKRLAAVRHSGEPAKLSGAVIQVTVAERDASILRLEP